MFHNKKVGQQHSLKIMKLHNQKSSDNRTMKRKLDEKGSKKSMKIINKSELSS